MLKRSPLRRADPTARASVPVFKDRKCKAQGCDNKFKPRQGFEVWCSPDCGFKIHQAREAARVIALAKKEKRETKAKLDDLKPLSYWEGKAQDAINWYVKARDFHKGCASCDLPATWGGQWHASHFRSVGAATAVRYHLWNVRKACVGCNHFKSGNLAGYEPRLRADIGDERVDWLKSQNQIVRYSREYLQRLQRVFNKKARRQERRNRA